MEKSYSESYAAAGVDITAGYRSVELMKQYVARTMNEHCIGGLGGFVHGFHLVTPLGGDDTVLIKRYNALVSSLGEGKVALRLVPELPGGGHNLAAGTGVYLLVLLLGHLLQGIHLAVFGFDGGAVDDDKRIACLHPVALLYEEGVHTSGQLPADTYFRCFHLSLQNQGLPAHE
mgnify:CR=1 FL=1